MGNGSCIQGLKNIFGLGLAMSKSRFKLGNEGTWLGFLWYLINPILSFLLMLGIFSRIIDQDIPNYPLYLFLGIIIFGFFEAFSGSSVGIIRGNSAIIKSINFRHESLIVSNILTILYSHFFKVLILIFFLLFFKISVFSLLYYPIILFFLSIFGLGVSLALSSFGAYFFDLSKVWSFFVRMVWFATPIFYFADANSFLGKISLFNPMYYFITIARDIIIYKQIPEMWMILTAVFFSLFALFFGLLIFKKYSGRYAEII